MNIRTIVNPEKLQVRRRRNRAPLGEIEESFAASLSPGDTFLIGGQIATISGLLQRNLPGARKSGKQATFASDILYDTLLKYDPDHLLLRITRDAARHGLVDFDRIEDMLSAPPQLVHTHPPHVTPLVAPLLLEAGKVPIRGLGAERLLEAEAARMMAEAGLT